jgi:peroxiredoxin Q/BCP
VATFLDLLKMVLQRGGTAQMLHAGDPAPDFTSTTHEGKDLALATLRGKKVLLWFYPKADTPG